MELSCKLPTGLLSFIYVLDVGECLEFVKSNPVMTSAILWMLLSSNVALSSPYKILHVPDDLLSKMEKALIDVISTLEAVFDARNYLTSSL